MRKNTFLGLLVILMIFGFIGCGSDDNPVTTYTVTFNSNGGSNVSAIVGIASGSTINKPDDPIKGLDTFVGWFKNENLTTKWNFSSDIVTDDITLYAKWETAKERDEQIFKDVREYFGNPDVRTFSWGNGGQRSEFHFYTTTYDGSMLNSVSTYLNNLPNDKTFFDKLATLSAGDRSDLAFELRLFQDNERSVFEIWIQYPNFELVVYEVVSEKVFDITLAMVELILPQVQERKERNEQIFKDVWEYFGNPDVRTFSWGNGGQRSEFHFYTTTYDGSMLNLVSTYLNNLPNDKTFFDKLATLSAGDRSDLAFELRLFQDDKRSIFEIWIQYPNFELVVYGVVPEKVFDITLAMVESVDK